MSVTNTPLPTHRWTAEELRQLPPTERDRILRAAAARAEEVYRSDKDLTDFNAFGEEDLHADSSNAEPR